MQVEDEHMRRSDEKLVASAIERCLDVMGEKCRRNEPDLKYDEKLDRKGHTRLSKAGNKATANAAAVTAAGGGGAGSTGPGATATTKASRQRGQLTTGESLQAARSIEDALKDVELKCNPETFQRLRRATKHARHEPAIKDLEVRGKGVLCVSLCLCLCLFVFCSRVPLLVVQERILRGSSNKLHSALRTLKRLVENKRPLFPCHERCCFALFRSSDLLLVFLCPGSCGAQQL